MWTADETLFGKNKNKMVSARGAPEKKKNICLYNVVFWVDGAQT
jgi:hypothetical protein